MANRHFLRAPSNHRQTLISLPKMFFLAAIRISSQTYPLLCGHSASYKRRLSASIRSRSASMRQSSASIRRRSGTDPARDAARPTPSASAPAEKRQIEHFKIPQKGTFRPKTAPKKLGSGLPTRSQTWGDAGFSLRLPERNAHSKCQKFFSEMAQGVKLNPFCSQEGTYGISFKSPPLAKGGWGDLGRGLVLRRKN